MSADPRSHTPSSSNAPTLDECGVDWIEALALELVRWICDAYACPTRSGWEKAVARADAVLGMDDGPRLFGAVVAVMAAVRRGRRGGFLYASPLCSICCSRLLPHEEDLLRVIRAGRRDDPEGIDAHALLLLGGQDTTLIRTAALRLGVLMAEVDGRLEAFNRTWRWPEPRPLPPGTGLKYRDWHEDTGAAND